MLPSVKTFDETTAQDLQDAINQWYTALLLGLPEDTHIVVENTTYQQPSNNRLTALIAYAVYSRQ